MQWRFFAALGAAACGMPHAWASDTPMARFDVMAYQVIGNTTLGTADIERAVYPFLGPQRSEADVEAARAALQALYADKGLATVAVSIPEQDAGGGLVTLQVSEQRIGRLRVNGARYFSPDAIASGANSLAEGGVPDFAAVQRDIVALNQWPDRRVTPDVKPGARPNTVDVDLNVDDSLPLHGNLELNNRNSANTAELRLSGSVRYDNLWQRGHSFTVSAQTAPQHPSDARVVSASYLARFGASPWSLLGYAVRSDSEVAAIGGFNVIGNGSLYGLRLIRTLPGDAGFFHTLSLGVDDKDFREDTLFGGDRSSAPIHYLPLSAAYSATWSTPRGTDTLELTATMNVRGAGDDSARFDVKRYQARANFFHVRADVSRTRSFAGDYQWSARLQTQLASEPLISNEQFSIGGMDSVRGYFESQALGDYGAAGQFELRSPSFASAAGRTVQDARLHAFLDAGYVRIHSPLPEQLASETLVSTGLGATFRAFERLNGVLEVAAPLSSPSGQKQKDINVLFRLWSEF